MMKQEFEELAGYEVSAEDYRTIIEPMYMAIPEGISKREFVKMLDRKRFALPTRKQVVNRMKKLAAQITEASMDWKRTDADEEELDRIAKEYAKRFYGMDWDHDSNAHVYFLPYDVAANCRGLRCPGTLIIAYGGRNGSTIHEYERIQLL